MKLINCYISSFGRLKNFSYDFNDDITVIMQENGWGKTTFATFIKSMFYGLNDSKRSIEDNERKKFAPWNSTEKFGGKISFSLGEKQFEIERFFGKKASDDSMKLTDLSTGIVHQENSDWGKRIFKIDEEGFLSTTYFTQKDLIVKENHSVLEKFTATCEVEQSEQFEKAVQKLENKIKSYSYSGGRGLIPQTENEIHNLKNQLENQNFAKENANTIRNDLLEKEKEILSYKQKAKILSSQWEEACKSDAVKIKLQQYFDIKQQIEQQDNNIVQANKVLNNNKISNENLNDYAQCINDLQKANDKIDLITNDISSLRKQSESITAQQTSKSSILNKNSISIFLILSTLLLIGGVFISAFLSIVIGIVVAVIGLVGTIIFALLLFKGGTNLDNVNQVSPINNLLQEKNTQLDELNQIVKQYTNILNEFFVKFNILGNLQFNEKLNVIERSNNLLNNSLKEKENSTIKIKNLILDLSNMGYNVEENDLKDEKLLNIYNNINVDNSNKIKIELDQINRIITQLENQVFNQKIKLNSYELDGEKADETLIKINELNEQLNEYKNQLNLYSLTLKYIKQADVNLKIKYREPLVTALNKYLNYVNNSKILGNIDINLKMTVDENGVSTDTDFYSKGYKDLFEICKRFALIEILFKDEKPFIILDDPFCNLDQEKIDKSLKLLNEISKDYQLIYFTCHQSRNID